MAKLRIYKKYFQKGFYDSNYFKMGKLSSFRIPKDILDKLNLAVGDLVNISQKIIINNRTSKKEKNIV